MDVVEALATRRSVGTFSDAPLKRDVIAQLVEAATWAPNHHLTEPWRFVVIAGEERTRFGEHVATWLESPTNGQQRTTGQIESIRRKLLRAPVIVAVIQRGANEGPVRDLEDYAACCCATQNLLLAAHSEGLASKWSTGELATIPPAVEYLGLKEQDRIVAYVYVGYPAILNEMIRASRRPPEIAWLGL